jgi:lipooligosaccharide transport system permease protein
MSNRTGPGAPALPLRVLPWPALSRLRHLFGGRASLHLIERHARAYKHAWLVLLSGLGEPLFYLLSLGVGLGKLVGSVAGVSYAAFVAPALLATSAMNGAIYDSTFNVYFLLKYAKLYDSVLATPVRATDVALGQIGWALIRSTLYAVAFITVMLAAWPPAPSCAAGRTSST